MAISRFYQAPKFNMAQDWHVPEFPVLDQAKYLDLFKGLQDEYTQASALSSMEIPKASGDIAGQEYINNWRASLDKSIQETTDLYSAGDVAKGRRALNKTKLGATKELATGHLSHVMQQGLQYKDYMSKLEENTFVTPQDKAKLRMIAALDASKGSLKVDPQTGEIVRQNLNQPFVLDEAINPSQIFMDWAKNANPDVIANMGWELRDDGIMYKVGTKNEILSEKEIIGGLSKMMLSDPRLQKLVQFREQLDTFGLSDAEKEAYLKDPKQVYSALLPGIEGVADLIGYRKNLFDPDIQVLNHSRGNGSTKDKEVDKSPTTHLYPVSTGVQGFMAVPWFMLGSEDGLALNDFKAIEKNIDVYLKDITGYDKDGNAKFLKKLEEKGGFGSGALKQLITEFPKDVNFDNISKELPMPYIQMMNQDIRKAVRDNLVKNGQNPLPSDVDAVIDNMNTEIAKYNQVITFQRELLDLSMAKADTKGKPAHKEALENLVAFGTNYNKYAGTPEDLVRTKLFKEKIKDRSFINAITTTTAFEGSIFSSSATGNTNVQKAAYLKGQPGYDLINGNMSEKEMESFFKKPENQGIFQDVQRQLLKEQEQIASKYNKESLKDLTKTYTMKYNTFSTLGTLNPDELDELTTSQMLDDKKITQFQAQEVKLAKSMKPKFNADGSLKNPSMIKNLQVTPVTEFSLAGGVNKAEAKRYASSGKPLEPSKLGNISGADYLGLSVDANGNFQALAQLLDKNGNKINDAYVLIAPPPGFQNELFKSMGIIIDPNTTAKIIETQLNTTSMYRGPNEDPKDKVWDASNIFGGGNKVVVRKGESPDGSYNYRMDVQGPDGSSNAVITSNNIFDLADKFNMMMNYSKGNLSGRKNSDFTKAEVTANKAAVERAVRNKGYARPQVYQGGDFTEDLLRLIQVESAGTFSTDITDPLGETMGLFQFRQSYLPNNLSLAQVSRMSIDEQLDLGFENWIRPKYDKITNRAELYKTIFQPNLVGSNPKMNQLPQALLNANGNFREYANKYPERTFNQAIEDLIYKNK